MLINPSLHGITTRPVVGPTIIATGLLITEDKMATRKRTRSRRPMTAQQQKEALNDGAITAAVMLLCLGLMTGLFMILQR